MSAFYAGLAALIALAIGWFGGRLSGAAHEKSRQSARERERVEHQLKQIAAAAAARNHVGPDDGVPVDKYRRD